ncbi:MAG: rod shape-determining protein MreC [Spirochaetaceae bacterium]|jgi:rod shape-determining protein MreC|nr:rod shape-determining protein MreC [Spirochaetaceae bacterium]
MTRGGIGRKKRVSADIYVFVALMLLSFSLLLLSTRSFVFNIKDFGLSLFSGLRGAIYTVSSAVSHTALSMRELITLRSEYDELLKRISDYEYLERSAAGIRAENDRFREQLDFSRTLRYRHIPAEISGRDPDNVFQAFVISKGKKHGIENNMPVIAFQNGMQALAGKVIQSGQLESLVMPLYDRRCFVSTRLSQGRYEGIVEGQGSPTLPLLMRSLSKRALDDISVGDIVVTSGMGGVYPAGIMLGRVSGILFHEHETSLEVELESALDFSRLEYVFVLEKESIKDESADIGGMENVSE